VRAPTRPRWAAVAVVLRDDALLLVRRSARPGDPWSGDWAFPGGFGHADDDDPAATARRETREEVGLALGSPVRELRKRWIVDPWRRRFVRLVPVVFTAPVDAELVLAPGEISEARWVGRASLANPRRQWRWVRGRIPLWVKVRDVGPGVVWGLTGAILDDLEESVWHCAQRNGSSSG
jgi:8-oxo-dGTP pyrophosphatase MutT (NUDIX family)